VQSQRGLRTPRCADSDVVYAPLARARISDRIERGSYKSSGKKKEYLGGVSRQKARENGNAPVEEERNDSRRERGRARRCFQRYRGQRETHD